MLWPESAENGRYCDGSRHRRRAPMRSRSGPTGGCRAAPEADRRVATRALPARLKAGSGPPRASPATTYSVFTAWKVNSANYFALTGFSEVVCVVAFLKMYRLVLVCGAK